MVYLFRNTAPNMSMKLNIYIPKANHRAVGTSCFEAKAGSMIEFSTAASPIVESMHPKASEIN